MVSQPTVRSRVSESIDRLTIEFRGMFSSETIRDVVTRSFESYGDPRVTDFVPLLVYKSARDELVSLTHTGAPGGAADLQE